MRLVQVSGQLELEYAQCERGVFCEQRNRCSVHGNQRYGTHGHRRTPSGNDGTAQSTAGAPLLALLLFHPNAIQLAVVCLKVLATGLGSCGMSALIYFGVHSFTQVTTSRVHSNLTLTWTHAGWLAVSRP